MATGSGQRLKAKLAQVNGGLRKASEAFWGHPRLARVYPELLREVYLCSRAAIPLLGAVRAQAVERSPGDPVCVRLDTYLAKHMVEEEGHHLWVLDDLAALGLDPRREATRPPSPWTTSLLGAQYLWAHQVHPIAIMGLLALFEGDPLTPARLEAIRQESGLPKAAFSFYDHHAVLDPAHAAEIYEVLDELDLSADQESVLGLSALYTLQELEDLLRSLLSRAAAA